MLLLVYEKRVGSLLMQLGSVVEQPGQLYFSTSEFSCQGMLVHRGTGSTPCHHLGAYQCLSMSLAWLFLQGHGFIRPSPLACELVILL